MATTESAKKVCVVCGVDVAGKPRVKDAAGRYMCAGECQEKAAEQARQTQAARAAAPKPAPAPSRPAAPPVAPPPAGDGLLGQLISDSPMLNAAKCESCGSAMPGGAVVCTRCGFNTRTGKSLKTAVIIEKEKKEPAAVSGSRYGGGGSDWGPSFGVLFLIVAAPLSGLCALGFVNPLFVFGGILLSGFVLFVGGIWGIIDAFRQGEPLYGILGILGFIFGLPGLAFLYYMLAVNELKWSKALYLGSALSLLIGLAVFYGVLGGEVDQLPK